MTQSTRDDVFWMRKAVALARRGEGFTRPNPPVGAVVVKAGRLIGSGYHHRAGEPHAEVLALRQAGRAARGSTLYITLEPCSTHGRTPPCTERIREVGVRRVVVAVRDPNPLHAGRGLSLLRRAGLRVDEGPCATEAAELIAPFTKWIRTHRPFVTLKLGMTLDGCTADANRRSKWITSDAARLQVQALRRRADVIMVGGATAREDDPCLLCRVGRCGPLWRVIVDSRGSLSPEARVLNDEARERTVVATTSRCPLSRRRAWLARGGQVWVLPAAAGRVSLPALLRRLGRLGLLHVMCEGGSELAASLVRGGYVDEFVFFVAPRLLGGRFSVPALGGAGWPLRKAPQLRFTDVRQVGPDLMVRAIPSGGESCSRD